MSTPDELRYWVFYQTQAEEAAAEYAALVAHKPLPTDQAGIAALIMDFMHSAPVRDRGMLKGDLR